MATLNRPSRQSTASRRRTTIRITALAPTLDDTQGWGTVPAFTVPRLREEHDVTVLTADARGEGDSQPELPKPLDAYHPVYVVSEGLRLRRRLDNPDLVHSFIAYPYLPMAAIATLGTDTPIVGTALGTYAVKPLAERIPGWLLRWAYQRAAAVACISEYTRDRIIRETEGVRTEVLPLGVDLNHFGPVSAREEGYVLCVGAIKRRKGQDLLMEAFGRIADDFPEIDLRFAGPVHDEEMASELRQWAIENGLNDRIHFHGKVDESELRDLYRKCTLFGLTPRAVNDNFEGFGLVYLEAAAFGKPSVATRSGGVPTAVADGESGILAPEEDVGEIAGALRQLLGDDDLRRAYGTAARTRAESMTWDLYTERLEALFETILPQQVD